MTPDAIFQVANTIALLAWVTLAVLPGRRWVAGGITAFIVPGLLAIAYAAIVLTQWAGLEGGFSSLTDVATLFRQPWALLAGWIHYLAFDLLIGSWEARDARERQIPHLLVLPCLALTFMFGPMGWLLYLGLRTAYAARARQET